MPLHLEDLAELSDESYGGKALGLSRLVLDGLNVPDGFAVSATRAGPDDWPETTREAFLRRFGHRAPRECDLATPRWSEDPSMVLELVRAGLADEEDEPLEARLARMRDERDTSVEFAPRQASVLRRPLMRRAARSSHGSLAYRRYSASTTPRRPSPTVKWCE